MPTDMKMSYNNQEVRVCKQATSFFTLEYVDRPEADPWLDSNNMD